MIATIAWRSQSQAKTGGCRYGRDIRTRSRSLPRQGALDTPGSECDIHGHEVISQGEATMGLRDRVRRDVGSGVQRYQMREQLLSIGDDYWIENESGERAFKVNGKAVRLRDTFVLEDAAGEEVAKIQERKLRVRDTMEIERAAGNATVHKALIGIRDRFKIEVDGGPDMTAHGNLVDHEYEIEADGNEVASVSKKWFRVRESYGVEVEPGQDDALILAITVCVDALTRD